ncbi:MAG: hypothetical protein Q4C49_12750 [Bacillota bacterium]|nr:hypothetical protein [Bacillota bacterium]
MERLEKFAIDCDKAIKTEKKIDKWIKGDTDTFFEKLMKKQVEDYYVNLIRNAAKHIKRTKTIKKILLG